MNEVASKLQTELAARMTDLFGKVIDERKASYANDQARHRDASEIGRIITHYTEMNVAISGAMGLAPGPFGLLAVVPEIALVVRNQLAMICDIAHVCGKDNLLDKELLAGVFATAAGLGGIGLVTMHGGTAIVKRASLRVFQKVIHLLAGNVAQKTIKAALGKWVPVAGAVAMAALSGISTRQLGKHAADILTKRIEIVDDEPIDIESQTTAPPTSMPTGFAAQKVAVLINLMKKDGRATPEELARIDSVIASAGLDEAVSARLRSQIGSDSSTEVDFAIFMKSPDEALSLLVEMVALAMADGDMSIAERLYIKHVGRLLGHSDADIDSLLDCGVPAAGVGSR